VVAFDEVERRPWTIEVTALELAEQVGDLSRRILAAEGSPGRFAAPTCPDSWS